MTTSRSFKLTAILLVFGCGGALQNDQNVRPNTSAIVFEVENQNFHSSYARIYITDRNCNPASASRYIEVSNGGKRSVILSSTDFNPGGFAIYVRLSGGVNGMNVIQDRCTESQPSPMPGSLVSLAIPSSLQYLMAPAIFPLRRGNQ